MTPCLITIEYCFGDIRKVVCPRLRPDPRRMEETRPQISRNGMSMRQMKNFVTEYRDQLPGKNTEQGVEII